MPPRHHPHSRRTMAMPAPVSGANANDVMANLAARLMGRMGASAPLAQLPASQASKETPRTISSPRAPAPVKVTPPQATSKAVPPPVAKENSPLKPPPVQPKAVQAVQELDFDMPDADKGPSLLGTADQLAVRYPAHSKGTQTDPARLHVSFLKQQLKVEERASLVPKSASVCCRKSPPPSAVAPARHAHRLHP